MQNLEFIVVALGILGFGLISGRVKSSMLTPPMAFVAFGLLIGPAGFSLVSLDLESPWIHLLAELTLILVLFTDATRIDLKLLRREHTIPVRLLLVGLPLTLLLGAAAAAWLFPGLGIWQALVLAAILSPTDAALGQAVVSSPRVPVRIRQALNVESGLNDGLVLPGLLIVLSCAGAAMHAQPASYWIGFTAQQVILGPLVGIAVGWLGGRLVVAASKSGWMDHPFQQLSALGLALLAFALAELLHGNGFISAFIAGLTLGNCHRSICGCLYEFAEAEGQLLTLLIFVVFGIAMVPVVLPHIDGTVLLYGAASLTLVRMLPTALSLIGCNMRFATTLFLGWFGPRGIASILFALLVLEQSEIPGKEMIFEIVVATVLISVFAHGITANPGAGLYARRIAKVDSGEAEHRQVSEMPLRVPGT